MVLLFLQDFRNQFFPSIFQRCSASPHRKWSRATWLLCRRPSTRWDLTSTIYAGRTTCWTDPRRSPACQTAAGAHRRHIVEVGRPSQPNHQCTSERTLNTESAFLFLVPAARCVIPAERSRVVIGGLKRWPFDVTDAMVPHGESVTFFCKHPRKQCSFTAAQTCFDGRLHTPGCYLGKPAPIRCSHLNLQNTSG